MFGLIGRARPGSLDAEHLNQGLFQIVPTTTAEARQPLAAAQVAAPHSESFAEVPSANPLGSIRSESAQDISRGPAGDLNRSYRHLTGVSIWASCRPLCWRADRPTQSGRNNHLRLPSEAPRDQVA